MRLLRIQLQSSQDNVKENTVFDCNKYHWVVGWQGITVYYNQTNILLNP